MQTLLNNNINDLDIKNENESFKETELAACNNIRKENVNNMKQITNISNANAQQCINNPFCKQLKQSQTTNDENISINTKNNIILHETLKNKKPTELIQLNNETINNNKEAKSLIIKETQSMDKYNSTDVESNYSTDMESMCDADNYNSDQSYVGPITKFENKKELKKALHDIDGLTEKEKNEVCKRHFLQPLTKAIKTNNITVQPINEQNTKNIKDKNNNNDIKKETEKENEIKYKYLTQPITKVVQTSNIKNIVYGKKIFNRHDCMLKGKSFRIECIGEKCVACKSFEKTLYKKKKESNKTPKIKTMKMKQRRHIKHRNIKKRKKKRDRK